MRSRQGVAFLVVLPIVCGVCLAYNGIRWLCHHHHHPKPVAAQTAPKVENAR